MLMQDKAVANLVTVEGTPDDARSRAMTIAAETNREHTPVRVFQQGDRPMLSAVLPVRVLIRILAHNAADRGAAAGKALTVRNRPQDKAHVRVIAGYLRGAIEKGEPYIIPSLTVNSTNGNFPAGLGKSSAGRAKGQCSCGSRDPDNRRNGCGAYRVCIP